MADKNRSLSVADIADAVMTASIVGRYLSNNRHIASISLMNTVMPVLMFNSFKLVKFEDAFSVFSLHPFTVGIYIIH